MLTKEEVGDMISNVHAPVAQLDRVLGYEPNGREFESLRVHQNQKEAKASFFMQAPVERTTFVTLAKKAGQQMDARYSVTSEACSLRISRV